MKSILIDIAKEVARHYSLELNELCQKSRKRDYVLPRQVAHYFSKKYTKKSLAEIGMIIGEKDHATVLHSVKTINNLIDTDKKVKEKISTIEPYVAFIVLNTDEEVIQEKKIRYNKARNLHGCRMAAIRHKINYTVEYIC